MDDGPEPVRDLYQRFKINYPRDRLARRIPQPFRVFERQAGG
jgi:hypothetical protein